MTTPRRWGARLRLLGAARLRLALVCAALAATAVTLLTALPAHAEPTPTPSDESAPSAPEVEGDREWRPAPTEDEIKEIEEVLREQTTRLTPGQQQTTLEEETEKLRKQLPQEGGVLGVFNVTDANGIPISTYSVRSDTGGLLAWDLGLANFLAEGFFMVTKWMIAFCCWLITWALSFGLAKLLLAPVLAIADSIHTRVILELGLPSLFLAVCALICVARIFFGDRAKGWGDAALSLLLAGLTTTLLASPPQTLMGEDGGVIAMARGLALEVATVIVDADPTDSAQAQGGEVTEAEPGALSRPLTDALTDAFIVKPAMLLQYGQVYDGECAQAYTDTRLKQLAVDRQIADRTSSLKKVTSLLDYIDPTDSFSGLIDGQTSMALSWGFNRFGDPPMEDFEDQCVKGDVTEAKKASLDKVGGALFLMIAAFIVSVLIIALAGSFLVAQCRIAWDAIRGEPALLAGTIPGAGRGYLWDWVASVLRSLGQMLWSVIGLAIFIVVVRAVLDPAQDEWGNELTLRFLVVDIICIAAVWKRKQLSTRSKQISHNFRTKMAASRIGGTHGSAVSPPAADAVTKNPHIAQKTARGLVRGTMATAALASGNSLAAAGYAMPQTVGSTALMSRLHGRRRPPNAPPRRAPHPTRSAHQSPARPGTQPRTTTAPPRPTTPPAPATPPRTAPPRPTHRPGAHPAAATRYRPGTARARAATARRADARIDQHRRDEQRRRGDLRGRLDRGL